MIGYRIVELIYLITVFTYGAPDGPFGAGFLGGIITRPLFVTLVLYLVVLLFFILFMKRISRKRVVIVFFFLLILTLYFLETEIKEMVIDQMVKGIDLKL